MQLSACLLDHHTHTHPHTHNLTDGSQRLVQCFAQGHFDVWSGEAEIELPTSSLVNGLSSS